MRDFNFHKYNEELGYRLPIPVYSGPYITAKPDIQVHELTAEDKWIVMGTDGLWDNFTKKDTAKLVNEQLESDKSTPDQHRGQKIIRALLQKSIEKAAKDSGVAPEFLASMDAGNKKRQIIDDVTIMVIDLEN